MSMYQNYNKKDLKFEIVTWTYLSNLNSTVQKLQQMGISNTVSPESQASMSITL